MVDYKEKITQVNTNMNINKDRRIGRKCRPRLNTHPLFYERGIVHDILEETDNIDAIIKIEMDSCNIIIERANDWITA